MSDLSSEIEKQLKYKIHLFVCTMLGLDADDHENDDETEPIETALTTIIDREVQKAEHSKDKATLSKLDDILDAHLWGDYGYSGTDTRTKLESWRKELKKGADK